MDLVIYVFIKKKVGKHGKAVGIEHLEDFVKKSIDNINNWNPTILSSGNLKLLRKKL